MIREHYNLSSIDVRQEVADPSLYGQQFSAEDTPVLLSLGQMTGPKTYGTPVTILILLKDCANGLVGGVTGQGQRVLGIRKGESHGI